MMTEAHSALANPRLKSRAKAIKDHLSKLGVEIKLGQAYEAMAIASGYNDWATMSAMTERQGDKSPVVDATEDQINVFRDAAERIVDACGLSNLDGKVEERRSDAYRDELDKLTHGPVHPIELRLSPIVEKYQNSNSVLSSVNERIRRFYQDALCAEVAEICENRMRSTIDRSLDFALFHLNDVGRTEHVDLMIRLAALEREVKEATDSYQFPAIAKAAVRFEREYPSDARSLIWVMLEGLREEMTAGKRDIALAASFLDISYANLASDMIGFMNSSAPVRNQTSDRVKRMMERNAKAIENFTHAYG